MSRPDLNLNLLVTLDVLLAEGSVARAGRRLHLSPSAMSRALSRLREATGDPLLVRAGRGLVPTPRAVELRERAARLVEEATVVLTPVAKPDLQRVTRTFTLRTSDGFVETFGPALISRVLREAPGIRLRFVNKTDRDSSLLRDGLVDLETGVVAAEAGPEVRVQSLFRDRFVGVVRAGHPLAKGRMTLARYATAAHVAFSRSGDVDRGPIESALASIGAKRDVAVIVGGFAAAIALARASDLVATVPERHTGSLRGRMHGFTLPFATPPIPVSMLWHPRMHADPVHRWLRECVRTVCASSA